MSVPPEVWVGAASFLAGLVDAMAGGGGLIQFPALLLGFPTTPVPVLAGSNKLASIAGTSVALRRYLGAVPLRGRGVLPVAGAAFLGSIAGALLLTRVPSDALRPVVLVLLALVAVFTGLRPEWGLRGDANARMPWGRGWIAGLGLGLYDGFFGPGTGTFLMFAFIGWGKMDFLRASASAKAVNVATNLAALAVLLPAGQVRYEIAAVLAVCNAAGAALGARLALRYGSRLVRRVFLSVVVVLLGRLAWVIGGAAQ